MFREQRTQPCETKPTGSDDEGLRKDSLWFIARTMTATAGMALVSWLSLHLLQSSFDLGITPWRLAVVMFLLLASGVAFLGIASLLKMQESGRLVRTASGLRHRAAAPQGSV